MHAPILNQDLASTGIPEKIRSFIFNLITNRKVYFKIGNELIGPLKMCMGLPQGCILSPLLYNIYTNQLTDQLHDHTEILQFADNTAIFTTANSLAHCISKTEISANRLTTHLAQRGLEISPEKTKLIIFGKKNIQPLNNISISLYGSTIHPTTEVKYLGIYFDYKLTWRRHIDYIAKKQLTPSISSKYLGEHGGENTHTHS